MGFLDSLFGSKQQRQWNPSMPAWQEDMVRQQLQKERGLANQPLDAQTQANLNLGRGALGRYSQAADQIDTDFNTQGYQDRFNVASRPLEEAYRRNVGQSNANFGAGGRLGSAAFARARNDLDTGLGRQLGDLSTRLYADERNRQLQAQQTRAGMLGNLQGMGLQSMRYDPSNISLQRQRLGNRLLGTNFGRYSTWNQPGIGTQLLGAGATIAGMGMNPFGAIAGGLGALGGGGNQLVLGPNARRGIGGF